MGKGLHNQLLSKKLKIVHSFPVDDYPAGFGNTIHLCSKNNLKDLNIFQFSTVLKDYPGYEKTSPVKDKYLVYAKGGRGMSPTARTEDGRIIQLGINELVELKNNDTKISIYNKIKQRGKELYFSFSHEEMPEYLGRVIGALSAKDFYEPEIISATRAFNSPLDSSLRLKNNYFLYAKIGKMKPNLDAIEDKFQ